MNRWLRAFFANEAAGGLVMLGTAALAMLLANSAAQPAYYALIHAPLPGGIDAHFAISDILMPLFFLFVGLELKHEMLQGALAQRSQRVLPLVAALGGIVVPALLYLAIIGDDVSLRQGWAIPTATDIAFALCVVNLAGARVPAAAKIFLLAIAIYDDLAAIIIIALFYSDDLALVPLCLSLAVMAVMTLLNRFSNARPLPMLLLGALLGFLLHDAGIHTTVAGMVTGLCIAKPFLKTTTHQLHPYIVFGILPLFAFASAGVDFSALTLDTAFTPLPLGIALGLFVGKQLGIFAATMGALKLGIARMPEGTDPYIIYAIGTIAGIGFTMSLFIGQLAFTDPLLQNELKLGVMAGSLLSAFTGLIMLRARRPGNA